MQVQRPFGFWTALALAVVLAVVGAAGRAHAQGNSASTVVRTLVYHEITAASAPVDTNGGAPPILSASGNRAAFGLLSYEPSRVAHIYLINTDGTGQQEVDTYPFSNGVADLDVSADGSKVISTYDGRTQVRIASADGRGGRPLVTLNPDTGRFEEIRLSSDGSLVFFLLAGDQPELADRTPLPAGLYVVNADGSGSPRRIVGVHEIAALLGLPENQFFGHDFGGSSEHALAVSSVAPLRIAFVTHIPPVLSGGASQGVFAVHLDGSNLVSLTGKQAWASVAISGDGATVGYEITPLDGTADIVGVAGANGTPREVARQPAGQPATFPSGFPNVLHDRLQLSFDGAWLLLGSTGVLVNLPTGYTLQLAMRGGWHSNDPEPILYDGLYKATMNESATRFLYMARDAKGVQQLATLDINPGALGPAPSITSASVNPPFVLTQGRSTTTISAQVGASGPLDQVGWAVVLSGLHDQHFNDDVMAGDLRAGAGLFTNAGAKTDCCAVAGLRTVRIKAEARSGDGKRHATAVEIAPFAVLDQSPAPGSTIAIPPSPTPTPIATPPGTTGGTNNGGTTNGGTPNGGTTGGTPPGGTQSIDLTGFWRDDNGAPYRIRQIGSDVFWSMENLPLVTNVFTGKLDGSTIGSTLTGQWVDLPGGQLQNSGMLMLRVESNDRMVKVGESIPYGGSVWTRVSGGATGGTTGGTAPGGATGGTTTGGTTGSTTGGTTSGTAGGICADPRALPIMDQWLAAASPAQQPGESLRYEAWGRLVGQSHGSTITVTGPPDAAAGMTRCEWLWTIADQLHSTNLGTLKEYVDQHLPIDITLTFSAAQVKGGTPVTGIVTLSRPRFGGGVGLFVVSDDDSIASVPGGLTVPAGATSGTFVITTHSVSASTGVGMYVDFTDLDPPVAGDPGEAVVTVTP